MTRLTFEHGSPSLKLFFQDFSRAKHLPGIIYIYVEVGVGTAASEDVKMRKFERTCMGISAVTLLRSIEVCATNHSPRKFIADFQPYLGCAD